MRRVLAFSLVILLAFLPVVRSDPSDPRDTLNVFRLISVKASPQLAPGASGAFVFNLTNPYSYPMQNISLNVSIYRYATIEETIPVDSRWAWEFPRIRYQTQCDGRECRVMLGGPIDRLAVPDHLQFDLTIATSTDMPHGTVFAQSSYFLRFWLEFDFNNGTRRDHLTMASRGYFTENQWSGATDPANRTLGCNPYNATNRCIGSLNLTRLGVDGIIPDSSFGVKEPFPLWPFYGLIALTVFFLVLALMFWVEENPGKYPRVERAWLGLKGRLRRVVRLPRLRKA